MVMGTAGRVSYGGDRMQYLAQLPAATVIYRGGLGSDGTRLP
jgi:hypothetical protein